MQGPPSHLSFSGHREPSALAPGSSPAGSPEVPSLLKPAALRQIPALRVPGEQSTTEFSPLFTSYLDTGSLGVAQVGQEHTHSSGRP